MIIPLISDICFDEIHKNGPTGWRSLLMKYSVLDQMAVCSRPGEVDNEILDIIGKKNRGTFICCGEEASKEDITDLLDFGLSTACVEKTILDGLVVDASSVETTSLPEKGRLAVSLPVGDLSTFIASPESEFQNKLENCKGNVKEIILDFRSSEKKLNDYTGLLPKLIEISKIGKAHNWDITVLPGENEKCYFNSEIIGKLHFLGLNVLVQCQWLETDLDIGDCLAACLKSDRPDGLLPTVVTDEHGVALGLVYSSAESIKESIKTRKGVYQSRSRGLWRKGETSGCTQTDEHGVALGLVYSSAESIKESIKTRKGVYQSRSRGLWRKGETSGCTQDVIKITLDCDSDTLRFIVHQIGSGFCHNGTWSCFGSVPGIPKLMRVLESRMNNAPTGSYTARLLNNPDLLHSKILEEAGELVEAVARDEIAWEAADVLYFSLVKCVKSGVRLAEIDAVLDQRGRKVTRRPGHAKPARSQPVALFDGIPGNPVKSMKCYSHGELSGEMFQKLTKRPAVVDVNKLTGIVKPILDDVRKNGDKALVKLTEKFDKVKLSTPVIDNLNETDVKLEKDLQDAIDLAYSNIFKFHKEQLNAKPVTVETVKGVVCSRHIRPIEKVGLYVPGGSAVLFSSALMLGVPAQVAGCKEIILATPPSRDGSVSPEILYVAKKVGVSKILLAGGAQAIGALAFGTESVPKVSKICGPGNEFVTVAKMLVQNDNNAMVSIDMPAGPTELLVVADASANPAYVAADLLSQAEHGPQSQVVLVAVDLTSEQLNVIVDEIEKQTDELPRKDIVKKSLENSFILKVENMEQALRFSNSYAPEHLILNVKDPEAYVPDIQNAGSVFLGQYATESCGDYASGANHTLPTYGYAHMYSGVTVDTYMKFVLVQSIDETGLRNIGKEVAIMANAEKLQAHRNAALIRLKDLEKA